MKYFCLFFALVFNLLAEQHLNDCDTMTLKTQLNIQSGCFIHHFIIQDEIFFLGIGSIFDDSTLKSTACLTKYNIKTQEVVINKSFDTIDSFYKILPYNNSYFILGAKALPEEYNKGRSYADKGFMGILIKLNHDEELEKYAEIPINGFGNVKDFLIKENKIIVLTAIKNSTIYDDNLYATLELRHFDTNLLFLNTLHLQTKDYLANSLYAKNEDFLLVDNYHNKICTFNQGGLIEKCFDLNDTVNEIAKVEKMKKNYSKKYQISAYDPTFHYALKQEIRYEQKLDLYLNIQYLYEIGAN